MVKWKKILIDIQNNLVSFYDNAYLSRHTLIVDVCDTLMYFNVFDDKVVLDVNVFGEYPIRHVFKLENPGYIGKIQEVVKKRHKVVKAMREDEEMVSELYKPDPRWLKRR